MAKYKLTETQLERLYEYEFPEDKQPLKQRFFSKEPIKQLGDYETIYKDKDFTTPKYGSDIKKTTALPGNQIKLPGDLKTSIGERQTLVNDVIERLIYGDNAFKEELTALIQKYNIEKKPQDIKFKVSDKPGFKTVNP